MRQRRNFLKRQHMRAYKTSRRFRNPYFPHKRKPFRRWRWALVIILAVTLLLGTLYGLSMLPWFQITDVTVSDLATIDEIAVADMVWEQIHERRWFVFPEQSWIFLDESELENRLAMSFAFSELQISREGHTLHIEVRERLTAVVWKSQDHWALLNLSGIVMRDLAEEEKLFFTSRVETGEGTLATPTIDPNIPVIADMSETEFQEGDALLSPAATQGLIALDEQLRAHALIPLLYQIASPLLHSMRLKTHIVDILVDVEGDVSEQVKATKVILDEYPPEELEYIDVRIGNNVYLKEKS